jgi:hypothetical protein
MLRRTLTFVLALVLCAFAPVASEAAQARAPQFALGELSLPPRTTAHHRELLTAALSAELEAHADAASQDAYVIDARLQQLRTERAQTARTRCALSLVLTRAESGAVFAIAEAQVTAEQAGAEQAEQAAIRAATRTAMERVVSTLRARRQPLAAR